MHLKINENVILVGTAHIAKDSVKEVREVIEEFKPDIVAVELCKKRYEAIKNRENWENTDVSSLIKEDKAYLLLAQIFLASLQRRLAKEYSIEPGAEMVAAIEEAERRNIKVALVDRDISITLKRAWKKMGLLEKIKVVWELLKAMVGYEEEIENIDIEKLMKDDAISAFIEEFKEFAPSVADVLIDERDNYIAKRIIEESKKGKVVAVVGAGHLKGLKEKLEGENLDVDLEELEMVPKKRVSISKLISYSIPIIFATLIIYIYTTFGLERAFDALKWWIIINGSLSAIGALVARAHPFSIITAFFAAPVTSLSPTIAAGWVAGYVEYKLRKPTVKDFKSLSKIESLRDFFNNRVIRLLMVVALANLGSMIGTFVAISYIIPK